MFTQPSTTYTPGGVAHSAEGLPLSTLATLFDRQTLASTIENDCVISAPGSVSCFAFLSHGGDCITVVKTIWVARAFPPPQAPYEAPAVTRLLRR